MQFVDQIKVLRCRGECADAWEGDRLVAPRGKRRGIGQITFNCSQSGRVDSGQGSFDDTDIVSIYLQKTFRPARANPRESAVMTGASGARKATLVKKKLTQMR